MLVMKQCDNSRSRSLKGRLTWRRGGFPVTTLTVPLLKLFIFWEYRIYDVSYEGAN